MKLPLLHLLVASGTRKKVGTTWFIDGNNLLGHRGTPKDAGALAKKLLPVRAASVVLVLDGRQGVAETAIDVTGSFQLVALGEGMSADDYIVDQIKAMVGGKPRKRVQVVTADRQLRCSVLDIKPVVRAVVNPLTFWKRYLPRLSGMKLPKSKLSRSNAAELDVDSPEPDVDSPEPDVDE